VISKEVEQQVKRRTWEKKKATLKKEDNRVGLFGRRRGRSQEDGRRRSSSGRVLRRGESEQTADVEDMVNTYIEMVCEDFKMKGDEMDWVVMVVVMVVVVVVVVVVDVGGGAVVI